MVNSGAPVEMPWRDQAAAVILTWFPGQEAGHALADVLTGTVEPGGRLPCTWPIALTDVPVQDLAPVDGALRYEEGIHVGHRAWLRDGRRPAYPFGHGLGYTTWELAHVAARPGPDGVGVECRLVNTGDRAGKQVVQVYAERSETAVERPVRWLVGFQAVHAEAGGAVTTTVLVPRRRFEHWDHGWLLEPGSFRLLVGFSVEDLPGTVDVLLDQPADKEEAR